MTLSVNIRIEAAPNFLGNLEAVHLFFVTQDADTAAERLRKLQAELREMIAVFVELVARQCSSGTFSDSAFSASAAAGRGGSTACCGSGLAAIA